MRISDWSSDVCSSDLPLSTASFEPLAHPDAAFSERPFLSPRVAMTLGRREASAAVEAYAREFAARGVEVERLSGDALAARIPALRPGSPEERRFGDGRCVTGSARWSPDTRTKKKD